MRRVGAGANIGAGTITCNYDGFDKHRTEIGAGAFVGSNSSLVAPVKIGAGAYIGSGSVVTRNVPDDALMVERSEPVTKEGWAKRFRELKGAAKGDAAKKRLTESDRRCRKPQQLFESIRQQIPLIRARSGFGEIFVACAASSAFSARVRSRIISSTRSSASNIAAMIPRASRRSKTARSTAAAPRASSRISKPG